MITPYPLFLKPVMMERVWGGNRLNRLHGKDIRPGQVIGESWEVSDRADAQSIIANGEFAGRTLRDLLIAYPRQILGPSLAAARPKWFPLLVKYVDAGDPLSVQVHPDDEGGRAFNDRGKSECWVIVHTEPGARIVRGLKRGVTRHEYEKAVASGAVEHVLHSFVPNVGDVVALPPGMVHAIGSGLVVAEVQQNSDITFRIYDYNRMGLDGKPRKLHIEEALHAIRFNGQGDEFAGDMSADTIMPLAVQNHASFKLEHLLDGKFFSLWRLILRPHAEYVLEPDPNAPRVMMILSGGGAIDLDHLATGQTLLLPAELPAVSLKSSAQELTVLIARPTAAAC